jgi:hypothetical protein
VTQHCDWQQLSSAMQQPHSSSAPLETELAQQHVGIDRIGSSKTETFNVNAISHRIVELNLTIHQVYILGNAVARKITARKTREFRY